MGHRCKACARAGKLGEIVSPNRGEPGLLRIEVPIKAGAIAPLTRLLTILAVIAEGCFIEIQYLTRVTSVVEQTAPLSETDPRLLGILRRLTCLWIRFAPGFWVLLMNLVA